MYLVGGAGGGGEGRGGRIVATSFSKTNVARLINSIEKLMTFVVDVCMRSCDCNTAACNATSYPCHSWTSNQTP